MTKTDLAPYLDVNLAQIEANVRQVNPHVRIIPVSTKTGDGLDQWFNWVRSQLVPSRSVPALMTD